MKLEVVTGHDEASESVPGVSELAKLVPIRNNATENTGIITVENKRTETA